MGVTIVPSRRALSLIPATIVESGRPKVVVWRPAPLGRLVPWPRGGDRNGGIQHVSDPVAHLLEHASMMEKKTRSSMTAEETSAQIRKNREKKKENKIIVATGCGQPGKLTPEQKPYQQPASCRTAPEQLRLVVNIETIVENTPPLLIELAKASNAADQQHWLDKAREASNQIEQLANIDGTHYPKPLAARIAQGFRDFGKIHKELLVQPDGSGIEYFEGVVDPSCHET